METNTLKQTRILLIDSDLTSAANLKTILEQSGYTVIPVTDGSAALAYCESSGLPDVALIADSLPQTQTLALCSDLHTVQGGGNDLPVLMIADDPTDKEINLIFEAGAADCILRPIHPGLLRRHVRMQVERRRMQHELNHRAERYDTIAHIASDYAYEMEVHEDGSISLLWITPNFAQLTGYTPQEMQNPDFWRTLMHPEDMDIALQRRTQLLKGNQHMCDYRLLHKNGHTIWVYDHAYPLWDEDAGRVIHIYSIGRDITDTRRMNEAMLNSQETLELALDAGEIGIWDWNMITNEAYYSPGWLRMLGYDPDEMPGTLTAWEERIHPDDIADVRAAMQAHTNEGAPYIVEHRLKTRDNNWRWIQSRGKIVLRDARNQPLRMAGIHRDIDERRRAEQALAKNEERHRIISETISDYAYSYIVQPDNTLKKDWSTQAFHDITGYTFEEMDADGWERLVHPDDQPTALTRFGRLLQGEIDISEFRIITKQGEIRWLRDHGHPVFDDRTGRVVHIYGAAQDITQRKHDEEKLRQQAEELRARNEELDAFAYSVAHDLKNPIASMMGFASLVQTYYDRMDAETIQEYITLIMEGGYKLKQIINALLMLAGVSKMNQAEIEPLDMATIVDDSTRRLAVMIQESEAHITTPNEWPIASGYGPWVEEVWMNYISNAIKYGGEPPVIQLGAEKLENGMLKFWVVDNGQGLNPDEQKRIFTPFTRLNSVKVEGHGLGLSVVQRIVDKLGGEVGVESDSGQGSRFSFTLPSA